MAGLGKKMCAFLARALCNLRHVMHRRIASHTAIPTQPQLGRPTLVGLLARRGNAAGVPANGLAKRHESVAAGNFDGH